MGDILGCNVLVAAHKQDGLRTQTPTICAHCFYLTAASLASSKAPLFYIWQLQFGSNCTDLGKNISNYLRYNKDMAWDVWMLQHILIVELHLIFHILIWRSHWILFLSQCVSKICWPTDRDIVLKFQTKSNAASMATLIMIAEQEFWTPNTAIGWTSMTLREESHRSGRQIYWRQKQEHVQAYKGVEVLVDVGTICGWTNDVKICKILVSFEYLNFIKLKLKHKVRLAQNSMS